MTARKRRVAVLDVSLPDDLRCYVEQRVRDGGFGNVNEFIRVLIRRDKAATTTAQAQHGSPAMKSHEGADVEDAVLDFSSEEWRTLREALLRVERQLVAQRLRDCASLFHTALSMTRTRLRRSDPAASEEVIDARLRSWLHEHEAWEVETAGFRRAPERLRRILGE